MCVCSSCSSTGTTPACSTLLQGTRQASRPSCPTSWRSTTTPSPRPPPPHSTRLTRTSASSWPTSARPATPAEPHNRRSCTGSQDVRALRRTTCSKALRQVLYVDVLRLLENSTYYSTRPDSYLGILSPHYESVEDTQSLASRSANLTESSIQTI